MVITLAVIFGFMVFMLLLNKGHIVFFGFFSFLIAVALSFGVGYCIAVLVTAMLGPILKGILIVAAIIFGLILLCGILGNRGD